MYLCDELVNDPRRVRKLRKFFNSVKQTSDLGPFAVTVQLYEDRMHDPGDRTRFYGCFGTRPGFSLQMEMLGLETLANLRLEKRPFKHRINQQRIRIYADKHGYSFVKVFILCKVEEAWKFAQSELGRLYCKEDGALFAHMSQLMKK